jgi:hypothetical protein
VVQRTCDFVADNVTHPQLWWPLSPVPGTVGNIMYRQLGHQQSTGGIMCLTTNSVYPFYVGTMSLGDCTFPASNAPYTERFVSRLFDP